MLIYTVCVVCVYTQIVYMLMSTIMYIYTICNVYLIQFHYFMYLKICLYIISILFFIIDIHFGAVMFTIYTTFLYYHLDAFPSFFPLSKYNYLDESLVT